MRPRRPHGGARGARPRRPRGSRDELPAPLLALLQPSEEAYPSGAEQLAARRARGDRAGRAWSGRTSTRSSRGGRSAWTRASSTPPATPSRSRFTAVPRTAPIPTSAGTRSWRWRRSLVSLHAQVGRRIDPLGAAVLTVGTIEGGSAENVIPAQARASAALRAHDPEHRRLLRELVREVSDGVAAAHGCTATVEIMPGGAAARERRGDRVRGAGADRRGRPVVRRPAGARAVPTTSPSSASSPPSRWRSWASTAPRAFDPRPLHHPELLVPDAAVGAVARVQAVMYLAAAAPARP